MVCQKIDRRVSPNAFSFYTSWGRIIMILARARATSALKQFGSTVGQQVTAKVHLSSSIVDNKIIINEFVVKPLDLKELQAWTDPSTRYRRLYKRFFRLRNLVDSNMHTVVNYCTILRRKFTREDFNVRRQVVLNKPPLTQTQLDQRILATLLFVHNSTVCLPENLETKKKVFFVDSLEPQRKERQIFHTLIEMETNKPNALKYDRHYSWYPKIEQDLQQLAEKPTKKEYQKVFKEPAVVGYRLYEHDLMMMNEMFETCL